MVYAFLGIGFPLLLVGSVAVLRGGRGLLSAFGVPPVFAGFFVASLAMCAPELSITLQATARGLPDIAMGDIIGSNIANLLLILGLGALIRPLPGPPRVVFRDGGVLIAASLALLVGAFHGSLTRLLGAIFLVGWIVYLVLAYVTEWRRPLPASGTNGAANGAHADYGIGVSVFLIAMGIACLFFAAFLVIDFALLVGRDFHVAPMAIALSAVALGTALPEFSATVGAREHANLASGKLIASSIFNILLVLGIVLLVSPIFVSSSLTGFDLPVMAAAAVLLPLLMLFGWRLTRIQGALLFACYITYLVFVGLHGGVRLPI